MLFYRENLSGLYPEYANQEKKNELLKEKYELKKQFVYGLLQKYGINIPFFLQSEFITSILEEDFIENFYGKIKGYDYECVGYDNDNIIETKIQNNHEMNLDNLTIIFEDNALILSDGEVSYKYEKSNDPKYRYNMRINGIIVNSKRFGRPRISCNKIEESFQEFLDEVKAYDERGKSASRDIWMKIKDKTYPFSE